MFKIIAILSVFVLSCPLAFSATGFVNKPSPAIGYKPFCRAEAFNKLKQLGVVNKVQPIIQSFRLVEVDVRFYNLSHYAWYEMDFNRGGKQLTARTLVQYVRLPRKCI